MLSKSKLLLVSFLFCHFLLSAGFASAADAPRLDFLLRNMRYSSDVDFAIRDESNLSALRTVAQRQIRNRRTDPVRVDLNEELLAALVLKMLVYHSQRFQSAEFIEDFGSPADVMASIKRMLLAYLDPGHLLFYETEIAAYLEDASPASHFEAFKTGNWDETYKIFPVYTKAVERYHSLAFDSTNLESVENAMNFIAANRLHTPIVEDLGKRLETTRSIERDEFDAIELAIVQQRAEVDERFQKFQGKYGRMEAVFSAILSGLDRFSSYIFGDDYRKWKYAQPSPKLGTLGIWGVQALGGLYLRKVYLNMPGFHAGLREGDTILSVDGESLADLSQAKQMQRMRGDPGSVASLVVLRGPERLNFEITRKARVATFADIIERNGRRLGYLEIGEFSEKSADEVAYQLHWLTQQNVEGLVLDLRDNMGGHLSQAVDVAAQFLGNVEPFGYVAHVGSGDDIPQPKTFMQYATQSTRLRFSKPVVVLTSGSTVSAGELLTMILKDHRRAVVVGARTFGKGVIQTGGHLSSVFFKNNRTGRYVMLKDAFEGMFLLNSAYFVDSQGRSPQAVGVEPDIELFPHEAFDPGSGGRKTPQALSVTALKSNTQSWIAEAAWNSLLTEVRESMDRDLAAKDEARIRDAGFSALLSVINAVEPGFGPPPKLEEPNVFKRTCQKILLKLGVN